jgi:hypothetical protein
MTDEQMDERFALLAEEDGPFMRMEELRQLLMTPQQRAAEAKYEAWLDTLSMEQLNDVLAGRLAPPWS